MPRRRRRLATDLVLGAAAGASATWLMDKVTTAMYERESRAVRKRENKARGNKTAYEIAAERASDFVGIPVTKQTRKQIGSAIHWSLGVTAGAVYGVVRNRVRTVRFGSGLIYGTLFWLAMDEAALTALKLTPPPRAFPWQTHARGLAGHLVLGGAIEAVFDVADLV